MAGARSLFNAIEGTRNAARLDFTTCLSFAITQLKEDKAIGSVPELLERIFSYAESAPEISSTEQFSDKRGFAVFRDWLLNLPSQLPLKTGELWTKGRHFAVVDLTG